MKLSTSGPDLAAVHRAVESVPDPELPVVTIGNLGMVHDVDVDGEGRVRVELLPTFSGCPATEVIAEDVAAAVADLEGVASVEVRFRFDPPWSPDRIDDGGRRALRGFGITPPGEVVASPALEDAPDAAMLPLARRPSERPCPYCGSERTTTDSSFGPTPCRSLHFCERCRQPFEAFKAL